MKLICLDSIYISTVPVRSGKRGVWCKVLNVRGTRGHQNRTSASKGRGSFCANAIIECPRVCSFNNVVMIKTYFLFQDQGKNGSKIYCSLIFCFTFHDHRLVMIFQWHFSTSCSDNNFYRWNAFLVCDFYYWYFEGG